jgi:hypothetical protein
MISSYRTNASLGNIHEEGFFCHIATKMVARQANPLETFPFDFCTASNVAKKHFCMFKHRFT